MNRLIESTTEILGNLYCGLPTGMLTNLAEITGDIGRGLTAAFGCACAAIGVAVIGTKAVESVGRNPGASAKILVQSILGMALAEAVAFYVLFLYQG